MSDKREFRLRPFPTIPAFPEERKVQLDPFGVTAVQLPPEGVPAFVANPERVKIAQSIEQYVGTESSSDSRRRAIDGLLQPGSDSPALSSVVLYVNELFQSIAEKPRGDLTLDDQKRVRAYAEFADKIIAKKLGKTAEESPFTGIEEFPESLDAKFIFQTHGVMDGWKGFDRAVEQMYGHFQGVFKPGEINYLLKEDPNGERAGRKLYIAGLKKYKSRNLAHAYETWMESSGAEPTQQELQDTWKFLQSERRKKVKHPNHIYHYVVDQALDRLHGEGIEVAEVYEQGVATPGPFRRENKFRSLADMQAFYGEVYDQNVAREWIIARQCDVLLNNSAGRPTNLVGLLGTAHYGLPRFFSPRLRQVSKVVSQEKWTEPEPSAVIQKSMTEGRPIPQSAWESAFEYIRKNPSSKLQVVS